jgi:alcohol dehydrogenase class IV
LEREVVQLGAERALVLCTREQRESAEQIAKILGSRAAGIYAEATMHVPIECARAARDEAERLGADCAISIGGGSTTGLAKAIALESSLPIISIPTTYAGSEMTSIYGLTEGGVKRTGRDPRVLPRVVIYDPTLTTSMPIGLTAASGMNAIAHAAEGLYAQDANPVVSLMAEEGIRAMAAGLFELVRALKLPHSLREIGFQPEDIDKAAGLAMRNPYWNPRPFSQQDIRELLERAYVGDCPQ